MKRTLPSAFLFSLLCAAIGCSAGNEQDADRTSDSSTEVSLTAVAAAGAAITQANVYGNERYWPAIIALTEKWSPPGETSPLKAQYRGTLVRVEADGRVRIDFGRHGRHDVPMDHTDLVQRANEVRTGARTKLAPNFVLRVGNSLVDSSSRPLRPYSLDEIARASRYLCIFADPRAEDFPILARQVAALEGANGVRGVFFPQSLVREENLEFVDEQLEKASWRVAFMYPQLSESYTLSLLGAIPERPRALLVSPEGRVLYQAGVGTAVELHDLRQAVERLGPPTGERAMASRPSSLRSEPL